MNMRKSLLAALVAVACLGTVGAASADAVEYAHHVGIESGANYFGPYVSLYYSEVVGYGQGIGCAGIRGISGVSCEPGPGESGAVILSYYVSSEPYIHNHATYTSYYNGWYY
jgi:hypothetical protein